jgi:hypothetical protein
VAHQLAAQHEQLAVGRFGALAHRALVFQPAGDAAAQVNGSANCSEGLTRRY